MTYTRAIGVACNRVIRQIVRGLALSRIHPNVLTFIGLLINIAAAVLLGMGSFFAAGLVIIGAGIFDMVDGRVARETNRVTRFGGFFDSVLDRYSDLALLMGLLVWYGTINRPFYVVLTAIVMTASVMISYARSRAENVIPTCKVGFMERPERVVLFIIGALFDRMAAVLWVIAVLGNLTVIHRMLFT
jgi:CDP-diacylglycerol--glycerol-3-phosphate 3-phosphatidyltransferase